MRQSRLTAGPWGLAYLACLAYPVPPPCPDPPACLASQVSQNETCLKMRQSQNETKAKTGEAGPGLQINGHSWKNTLKGCTDERKNSCADCSEMG